MELVAHPFGILDWLIDWLDAIHHVLSHDRFCFAVLPQLFLLFLWRHVEQFVVQESTSQLAQIEGVADDLNVSE